NSQQNQNSRTLSLAPSFLLPLSSPTTSICLLSSAIASTAPGDIRFVNFRMIVRELPSTSIALNPSCNPSFSA
ncbi:hypothetical protein ES288_A13G131100v1, partial [Gossypium darwinii]